MALNPSGAISLGGPSTGQSIAVELGLSPTASISLNQTNVRTLAGVPSGTIIMPTNFWGKSNITNTQKAIFGYGSDRTLTYNITNLVSNTGVMASNTPGVGNLTTGLAGAGYGGDKALYAYGRAATTPVFTNLNTKKLISNTGVVSADSAGAGTARLNLGAACYGGDKAIFGFGQIPSPIRYQNMTNLVSNTGILATDTPGVGTARVSPAGATYGGDKAIFSYGGGGGNITNLVSNTGVVQANTPGVGTQRTCAAAGYGGDKAIFSFGTSSLSANISNLISNTGIVSADVTSFNGRINTAGATYGGDKAIFAFGVVSAAPVVADTSVTNLVSNTGVVAANTPGVGTARSSIAAAGYSYI